MDYRLLKDHDYALIDRAQLRESVDHLPIKSLAPQHLQSDTHLLPAVLVLNELSEDARAKLLDLIIEQTQAGEPPLSGCLIASSQSPEATVSHLKRQLIVSAGDGQRELFRFYDPRVLSHLCWILDTEYINALLGDASHWTYFDRGQWRTIGPKPGPYRRVVGYSSEQWAAVQRIGLINRAMARLQIPAETEPDEVGRPIDRLLRRASMDHGLVDRQDLVAFAVHGMRWHRKFDRHPKISAVLRERGTHRKGYRDATALMGEDDWQRIAEELNGTERV